MIAMALVCEPKLLIADEPTTALDVTIQAQILDLIDDLRERLRMAVMLITHDMGVIAGRTDRVVVMYAGKVVEEADDRELFHRMRHPYTEALLASVPKLDQDPGEPLLSIPGLPPDLSEPIANCRFAPRCRYATEQCRTEEPPLEPTATAPTRRTALPASTRSTPRRPGRRGRRMPRRRRRRRRARPRIAARRRPASSRSTRPGQGVPGHGRRAHPPPGRAR